MCHKRRRQVIGWLKNGRRWYYSTVAVTGESLVPPRDSRCQIKFCQSSSSSPKCQATMTAAAGEYVLYIILPSSRARSRYTTRPSVLQALSVKLGGAEHSTECEAAAPPKDDRQLKESTTDEKIGLRVAARRGPTTKHGSRRPAAGINYSINIVSTSPTVI